MNPIISPNCMLGYDSVSWMKPIDENSTAKP